MKTRRRVFNLVALVALLISTFAIVPTAGANTQKMISAKALVDHECDSTELHFVINQVQDEGSAPPSIHVTWANGAEADVARGAFTGKVAHYTTTLHLDSQVLSATAWIYQEWGGEFNLSHGPCGPPQPVCEDVIVYERTDWNPWGDCADGWRTRTGTYYWWTQDVVTGQVCDEVDRPVSEQKRCDTPFCEIVDPHEKVTRTPLGACVDGHQLFEITVETWTTDRGDPNIVCGQASSVRIERLPCEEPKEPTTPGRQYWIRSWLGFSVEIYQADHWNFNKDEPNKDEDGNYLRSNAQWRDCSDDFCKFQPQIGFWEYSQGVGIMGANCAVDPYGAYWGVIVFHDGTRWVPLGVFRGGAWKIEVEAESFAEAQLWVDEWPGDQIDEGEPLLAFNHSEYQEADYGVFKGWVLGLCS